jgi:hypothetical protein
MWRRAMRLAAGAALLMAAAIPRGWGACPAGTDLDGDGYGNPGSTACPNGPDVDCDDTNAAIHPGAIEVCDGVDQNCDGLVDNAGAIELAVTPGMLTWTPVTGATGYDVVRGDLTMLQSSWGDFDLSLTGCDANAAAGATLAAPYAPGSGQFFFLVRADTSVCGLPWWGTYDSMAGSQHGSRDAEAQASAQDCVAP